MLFSSILCYLTLLFTSVSAIPAAFEDDFQALDDQFADLDKRQNSFYAITGTGSTQRPRLEVRELQTKPNQWTLFLLALRQFHDMPQSDKLSYYQISGIHGVPRVNWDNVGQCSTCSGADGYCTHDSILFLGWHRAYMALFEQRFVEIAKSIAQQYPAGSKRQAMVGAANLLRWPFWDWAAHPPNGGDVVPSSFTAKTVTVDSPTGSRSIVNPLFRHDFTDPSQLVYSPFINWKVSLRYPISNANTASSNTGSAVAGLNNIRASMQDQVYNMFSTCDEFVEIGSDAQGQSSSRCSSSIEGIHNTIHNAVGGGGSSGVSGGHMTYLATAAFDPAFWMHHCNVDRLFALWQGINPDAFTGSQVAPHNTWTVAQGSTQNLDSALTPFHRNTNGDFWTTNLLRSWWTLGYTYPEYQNSDGSKAAIQSIVNKLYGPSATATAGTATKRTAMPEPQTSDASADITPLKADNGSFYQYVANIKTPRYALNGSYWIYFFNGNPSSEEPTSWLLDQKLIGPVGVLAQVDMDMNKDLLAAYAIPLTRTLTEEVASGGLPNMDEDTAVPWLQDNLQWRIVNSDGETVDPNSVPGFEVTVYSSTATPPKEYELPVWSEFIPLADVTLAKAGGATAESLGIINSTVNALLNETASILS